LRLFLLALPLVACASAPSPGGEVDGLRAEVARLRVENASQDRELARLRRDDPARTSSVSTVAMGTTSTVRAEAAVEVAPVAPQIPENLKVVFVAPEPELLEEGPRPAAARTPHRRGSVSVSVAAATPLPTATALREPVLGEPPAPELSPEALAVAYTAALAAPDPSALEAFARTHADDARADNALFEAGLRAERAGQSERAAYDFGRAVAEHPAGDVVADALLHLATCQLQLHHPELARQTLGRITHQFQGSPQAEAAASRLADLTN
jgi:hypothetical protein